jgi:hypothetical protein
MNSTVHLSLICLAPPPERHNGRPAEFGLQDKHQILQPGIAQTDGSRRFDFDASVKRDPKDRPKFSGPFVHGTSNAQFLYLGYRLAQPPNSPWIKRLKITLSPIRWEQVEQAIAQDDVLEATISGESSASVPLLGEGWRTRKSEE